MSGWAESIVCPYSIQISQFLHLISNYCLQNQPNSQRNLNANFKGPCSITFQPLEVPSACRMPSLSGKFGPDRSWNPSNCPVSKPVASVSKSPLLTIKRHPFFSSADSVFACWCSPAGWWTEFLAGKSHSGPRLHKNQRTILKLHTTTFYACWNSLHFLEALTGPGLSGTYPSFRPECWHGSLRLFLTRSLQVIDVPSPCCMNILLLIEIRKLLLKNWCPTPLELTTIFHNLYNIATFKVRRRRTQIPWHV